MILAVCPYCRAGKVRAPRTAIGASATCPSCYNCFTIVDSREKPEPPRKSTRAAAPATTPPASDAGETRLRPTLPPAQPGLREDTATDFFEEPTVADADRVRLPPIVAPLPPPPTNVGRGGALTLSMIVITLAGVALGASQLPYGRFATAGLSGFGLLLGFFAVVGADRRWLWPAVGFALNAVALILVTLLPGWLGLDTWWPEKAEDQNITRMVGFDGKIAPMIDGQWVDAGKGGWQRGDVRVTVTQVWVGPVELVGPKEKRKLTKEKALVVGVRLTNMGGGKQIDYQSWNEPPPPGAMRVQAIDSAGKELPAKQFEEGWKFPGRGQSANLFPGHHGEDLLLFEAPAGDFKYLRLELPATAFGSPGEPVRFQIPKSMLMQ